MQSGGWGKSLLCPSVLLCQFVLWLLINENCCFNFELLQFLPVVFVFFFFSPQSQDLLFAEDGVKGKRFMARTFATSYRHPCVIPLGSLTYKTIYEK